MEVSELGPFPGMSGGPVAVPLVEQLRSIPIDAKLRIDTPNALGCMDTQSIPVGRLCHEAADAIRRTSIADTPEPQSKDDGEDQFCDGHCTWAEHHPDCPRSHGVGGKE